MEKINLNGCNYNFNFVVNCDMYVLRQICIDNNFCNKMDCKNYDDLLNMWDGQHFINELPDLIIKCSKMIFNGTDLNDYYNECFNDNEIFSHIVFELQRSINICCDFN